MCHTEVPYQQFVAHACPSANEPVVFLDLLLTIYTIRVEKKSLLSRLSIESSPGSEEGNGD